MPTRSSNPTVTSFEQRLARWRARGACMATASGHGGHHADVLGLLKAGDHVSLAVDVRLDHQA